MSINRHTADAVAAAEATSQKYQSLYPDISPISSLELLHDTFPPASSSTSMSSSAPLSNPQWRLHGRDVLLVDVRTQPERDVSMISGAISLNDFREDVLPSLLLSDELYQSSNLHTTTTTTTTASLKNNDANAASPHHLSRPGIIAMYCTIGFRSGMEARKLQQEYPSLFFGQWDDDDDDNCDIEGGIINNNSPQERESGTPRTIRIGNLDGILTFANATLEFPSIDIGLKESIQQSNVDMPSTNSTDFRDESQTLLVDHSTNQPAHRVHVYGPSWKQYLSPALGHEAVVFSNMEFAWRGIMVLGRSCCLSCRGCMK